MSADPDQPKDTASRSAPAKPITGFVVCVNRRGGSLKPSCGEAGGEDVVSALRQAIGRARADLTIDTICCLGRCDLGPTVREVPGGPFHLRVRPDQADQMVAAVMQSQGVGKED